MTLQLLNSSGTTRCTRYYQTLFLRSRVWGTRLTGPPGHDKKSFARSKNNVIFTQRRKDKNLIKIKLESVMSYKK